jgi:hypothetical protein
MLLELCAFNAIDRYIKIGNGDYFVGRAGAQNTMLAGTESPPHSVLAERDMRPASDALQCDNFGIGSNHVGFLARQ